LFVLLRERDGHSIAELERELAELDKEHAAAKAAHDEKVAADTRSANALVQASRKHEEAKAKLAEARAEEGQRAFVQMADPIVEALGGARNAVVAANERALAAALP
jgi:hypothetical protein